MDVEQNKLEDCHREIEIYRQQLESATHSVDQLKAEVMDLKESHADQMNALETKASNDKQEEINKVILEHEVELESLKNHLENSGKVAALESTIKSLKDQVKSHEEMLNYPLHASSRIKRSLLLTGSKEYRIFVIPGQVKSRRGGGLEAKNSSA